MGALKDGTAQAAAEQAVKEAASQGVQAAAQPIAQGASDKAIQEAVNTAVEKSGEELAKNTAQKSAVQQTIAKAKEKMASKGFNYYVKSQALKSGGEGYGEARKAGVMADAHEHQLMAKTHELNADKAQDMIENEAQENKMIMENVNTAFTKAIESLGRSHAAKSKLIASAKV